jgi:hypothetical protein
MARFITLGEAHHRTSVNAAMRPNLPRPFV